MPLHFSRERGWCHCALQFVSRWHHYAFGEACFWKRLGTAPERGGARDLGLALGVPALDFASRPAFAFASGSATAGESGDAGKHNGLSIKIGTLVDRYVPTSGRLDVGRSRRPDVWTSGRRDVPTSGRPDVQTSRRPDVQTSGRPDVGTSRRRDVRKSGRPEVRTSGRPDAYLS